MQNIIYLSSLLWKSEKKGTSKFIIPSYKYWGNLPANPNFKAYLQQILEENRSCTGVVRNTGKIKIKKKNCLNCNSKLYLGLGKVTAYAYESL